MQASTFERGHEYQELMEANALDAYGRNVLDYSLINKIR